MQWDTVDLTPGPRSSGVYETGLCSPSIHCPALNQGAGLRTFQPSSFDVIIPRPLGAWIPPHLRTRKQTQALRALEEACIREAVWWRTVVPVSWCWRFCVTRPLPRTTACSNPWEARAESWGMLPCWLRRGVPPCCEPEHGGATRQRVVVSLWVWSRR